MHHSNWLTISVGLVFIFFGDVVWGQRDSFAIVALPDTQNYVNDANNALLFTQQTQWVVDQIQLNGNPRNIQFVTHLGDLVSSGSSLTQWNRANASMNVLQGFVKYSVLPGNHDFASTGDKDTGFENYVDFFGPTRFADLSWYGGADPSGGNSYQTFSAGGFDFIHLALEWRPNENVPFRDPSPIEWAQSIIDAHPNIPVILSTHEHVDDEPAGRSASGEAVWQQLIKRNDQIFLILNGHYHGVGGNNDGEYHQVSLNDANRIVIEVLQDFQDYPNGGDGWLRLIKFDIPNNQICFETFSPVLNQFQTETVEQVGPFASQFDIPVDFGSRLVPVVLPPTTEPDFVFQQGVNGYSGAYDKELRSDGVDGDNGQQNEISVDGDDGSPGNQPTQCLLRFDHIIGNSRGQIAAGTQIDSARLTLEVSNAGSGFVIHRMLLPWDELSTWKDFGGNGVQANGIEAATEVIESIGANNSDSNVGGGELSVDVTESVQSYLDGNTTNFGWVLLPFLNGTNGIDFFSSEFDALSARPALEIDVAAQTVPQNHLTVLNGLQVAGQLADTVESDDVSLSFHPAIDATLSSAVVSIEFVAVLGKRPSRLLELVMETQANVAGLNQQIDVFNHLTAEFEQVDSRVASLGEDETVTLVLSDRIDHFVEKRTGNVKLRVRWQPNGLVLFYPWSVCIDRSVWNVK